MGDWSVLTTWFVCNRLADAEAVLACLHDALPRHRWIDRTRWGVRAGMLGSLLVQLDSIEYDGASTAFAELVQRHVGGVQLVHLCPERRVAVAPTGRASLGLAWNYVVTPANLDLPAVAECLGDGAVCHDLGAWRMLCMPTTAPLQLSDGPFPEVVMRDDPLGRLAYAFAVAEPKARGRTIYPLLGQYTPTHGWVHMISMALHLPARRWELDGQVVFENGSCYNRVQYQLSAGPSVPFIHGRTYDRIAMGGVRWPL